MTPWLSPEYRTASLERVTDQEAELDLVVIGGGVVGAGVALDAVSRGLSVALLEARDWASGTSSRSSKLLHGGLRYLEMLQFGLVREALRERTLLSERLAPHLVRTVPFMYPLRHRAWERGYAGLGIALYDAWGRVGAGSRRIPGHRHLGRAAALRECPGLRPDSLVGAIQYHDGLVDDARLALTVVRTAAAHGAEVVNRAEVVGLLRTAGRVCGVEVSDLESGARHRIRARHVVGATGVWTDDTQDLLGGDASGRQIRMSKGVHLVVPRSRVPSSTGLIVRTASSVLFLIPWGAHWIIGTTDTDWPAEREAAPSGADVDYLLAEVNKVLVEPLHRGDVEAVYAGLRPLLNHDAASTARLSREHLVHSPAPGMTTVAGGKYTTYRVMAKDAVDAVSRDLGGATPDSGTADLPLVGAPGFAPRWNARERIAARSGLTVSQVEHLLLRYGALVDDVLTLTETDPDLLHPVPGAPGYLRAEVAYAVRAEGAVHLDDVVVRRTRIAMETRDGGLAAAEHIAQAMGGILGWSADQQYAELESYRHLARAQFSSRPLDHVGS